MELLKEIIMENLELNVATVELDEVFNEADYVITEEQYQNLMDELEKIYEYKKYLYAYTTVLESIKNVLQTNASEEFLADYGTNLFNADLDRLDFIYEIACEDFAETFVDILKEVTKA